QGGAPRAPTRCTATVPAPAAGAYPTSLDPHAVVRRLVTVASSGSGVTRDRGRRVQTNSGCARATTNGFVDELWTLDRIALLIQRLTGISHHPAHVWALLRHRLGWTIQRPVRRAAARDQAAVDQWVAEHWPRIKQTPNDAKPVWSSSTNPRSA